jgi:hypothetical protein
MPISDTEFGKGKQRNPMDLILEFLRFNPHYAYNQNELARELASKGMDLMEEEVQKILDLLEAGGRIESKVIDGVTFYKHYNILGFRSPRRLM